MRKAEFKDRGVKGMRGDDDSESSDAFYSRALGMAERKPRSTKVSITEWIT